MSTVKTRHHGFTIGTLIKQNTLGRGFAALCKNSKSSEMPNLCWLAKKFGSNVLKELCEHCTFYFNEKEILKDQWPGNVVSAEVMLPSPHSQVKEVQPVWLCLLQGKQFEETFKNTHWEKVKQMQLMRLCIFSDRQFEDTFENAQWGKVIQMQPMWLCILLCKCFEGTH